MTTPVAAQELRAFNVLDEPWLPVRMHDGTLRDMGLLAVFRQCAQVQALAETSPPNLVAQHRLLLAVLHRALCRTVGSWSDSDRARWFGQGLPLDGIVDYLEHWRERFWLFHPERPFMQVAALATAVETRDKLKPWTQLSLGSANGNTPVVFDHAIDTEPSTIEAGQALRHLLGFLQFTPGGLVKVFRGSDKAGPVANSAAVMPAAGTLAASLLLALQPSSSAGLSADDLPSWERPAPSLLDLAHQPIPTAGPCDRYTRLTRAVLLGREPGEKAGVRWLHFGAGLAIEEDDNAPDPMVCHREGAAGPVRMTFSEGRDTWRDLGSLLPDAGHQRSRAAAVMEWAENLLDTADAHDEQLGVVVAGLCSDQAKLLRWRVERFALPRSVLQRDDLAAEVRRQLKRCDEMHAELKKLAAGMLAAAMPDSRSKDTRSRARQMLDAGPCSAAYFTVAERALPALLNAIADDDLDGAHERWSAALAQAIAVGWHSARLALGPSAKAIRAEAMHHARWRSLVRSLQPATTPEAEEASTA